MTTHEMKTYLASALRSIAHNIEHGASAEAPLCAAIPGDFHLEAVSQEAGCKVTATVRDRQASVVVEMNDPAPTDAGPSPGEATESLPNPGRV